MNQQKMASTGRKVLLVVGMLFVAAIPLILSYVFRDWIAGLGWQSYLGIFVLSFVSASGTITLGIPVAVPGLALTFLAGSILNPWLVGLIAGLGAGAGECFSYPVGTASRVLIKEGRLLHFVQTTLAKYGGWVIFLGAALPNPLFDFVGLASGLSGYRFRKFMILVIVGRIVRALLASYLGFCLLD